LTTCPRILTPDIIPPQAVTEESRPEDTDRETGRSVESPRGGRPGEVPS